MQFILHTHTHAHIHSIWTLFEVVKVLYWRTLILQTLVIIVPTLHVLNLNLYLIIKVNLIRILTITLKMSEKQSALLITFLGFLFFSCFTQSGKTSLYMQIACVWITHVALGGTEVEDNANCACHKWAVFSFFDQILLKRKSILFNEYNYYSSGVVWRKWLPVYHCQVLNERIWAVWSRLKNHVMFSCCWGAEKEPCYDNMSLSSTQPSHSTRLFIPFFFDDLSSEGVAVPKGKCFAIIHMGADGMPGQLTNH